MAGIKPKEELFAQGHTTCAGCGMAIAIRQILRVTGKNIVWCNATSCSEVTTTAYPQTSWKVPWIHVTFENVAAVAAGVKAALDEQGKKDVHVIAFAGDGGTADIGIGALSGAAERNDNILYIMYDNEAYMNTGVQRSSQTPFGAATTTSPAGKESFGEDKWKKNMVEIMAANGAVYAATASVSYQHDFQKKIKKALEMDGFKFIQVYAPCTPGWGIRNSDTVKVARLAVETGYWQLYEIQDGKKIINMKPTGKKVEEYLKIQKRFRHLKEEQIKEIQKHIDESWNKER